MSCHDAGWQWVDGTPLVYTNWAPDEDPFTRTGCVQLRPGSEARGAWTISECARRNNYLCRIPKCTGARSVQSNIYSY